jgi:hypothetical protein
MQNTLPTFWYGESSFPIRAQLATGDDVQSVAGSSAASMFENDNQLSDDDMAIEERLTEHKEYLEGERTRLLRSQKWSEEVGTDVTRILTPAASR